MLGTDQPELARAGLRSAPPPPSPGVCVVVRGGIWGVGAALILAIWVLFLSSAGPLGGGPTHASLNLGTKGRVQSLSLRAVSAVTGNM